MLKSNCIFDFKSVRVCYFDIHVDLGMSLLSNKWEPLFWYSTVYHPFDQPFYTHQSSIYIITLQTLLYYTRYIYKYRCSIYSGYVSIKEKKLVYHDPLTA